MGVKKQNISLPEELRNKIQGRASKDIKFSSQIQDDLGLAYALFDQGMITAYKTLSHPEVQLVLDVQNGAFFDHTQVFAWLHGGLAHQVSDAIALDRLDEKWEIDVPALIAKIKGLDDLSTIALVDWSRHMWRHREDQDHWDSEIKKFRD